MTHPNSEKSSVLSIPHPSRIMQTERASIAQLFVESRSSENSRKVAFYAFKRVGKLLDEQPHPYDIPFENMTPAIYERIKAALREDYSAATVKITLTMLRGLMRLAYQEGRITPEHYARIVGHHQG